MIPKVPVLVLVFCIATSLDTNTAFTETVIISCKEPQARPDPALPPLRVRVGIAKLVAILGFGNGLPGFRPLRV